MRARFATPTSPRRIFGRFLTVVIALTAFGLAPQFASALGFAGYEVSEVGYNQWLITGSVDAILDIDEHATIEFGDALAGHSTSTTAGGEFEYYFEAYAGEVISFTATMPTESSETEYYELPDANGGPQP